MLSSIWSGISSRARKTAAVLALAAATTVAAHAQTAPAPEKSAWSVALETDFVSHFISYGADVWGGGNEFSPFSPHSSAFVSGTFTVALSDNLSAFVNLWSDNNDNVDSGIGGPIQEIDVNTGLALTLDKVSISLANGFWNYASDTEKVLDLSVGYNDAGLISDDFSFSPSVALHYRYDGNNGQETGLAFVPGIKPSITVLKDTKYPVTLSAPTQVAIFTDGFQGGGSGYGYFTTGITAGVPLAFIPAKYGAWTASAGVAYWNTPDNAIPNNPRENFITTTLSVAVSF